MHKLPAYLVALRLKAALPVLLPASSVVCKTQLHLVDALACKPRLQAYPRFYKLIRVTCSHQH
jgi:hypothetical protein